MQARVSDTIKSGLVRHQSGEPGYNHRRNRRDPLRRGETISRRERGSDAAVAPANATDQALTFTSSSADVIKVDNSGRMTAAETGPRHW